MVTHQAKAAEVQAMLALTEAQLQRARIEALFDGIVIKGDLGQHLGAPVQRGEVPALLAPNDSFRLILEVDEADIAADLGQDGALALAAEPGRALAFRTRRIVPVAATAEGRNYFEVEAALEDTLPQLRPGLSGVAKVQAGWRPLGWLLATAPSTGCGLAWKVSPWWSAAPSARPGTGVGPRPSLAAGLRRCAAARTGLANALDSAWSATAPEPRRPRWSPGSTAADGEAL